MKIRAIITGATGMVGEGVLHECLNTADVEQVLVISRKPCGVTHPKLREIIHSNFFDITPIGGQLKDYNACFFCLGVTSVGKKEPEYTKLTYDLTLSFAKTLASVTNDMTFCYVSGIGTDSTEKGKSMWARVKGKTENELMKLPFKHAYMFRPCYMHPTKGLKNANKLYFLLGWLYPMLRATTSTLVSTLAEQGQAMIKAVTIGYEKNILEVKDIVTLAHK